MKIKTIINDEKICEKIRKAYRGGRKTVTIEGVKHSIARLDRKVTFTVTNKLGEKQEIKRTESWLTIKPVKESGGIAVAQIPYPKRDSNVRSKW
jgi:hypothetical protein